MLTVNTTLYHIKDYVKDAVDSFVAQKMSFDSIREQRALPYLHPVSTEKLATGKRILLRSNTWGALWLELDAMNRMIGSRLADSLDAWAALTKKNEVSSSKRNNIAKWMKPGTPIEQGLAKIKDRSYLWGRQTLNGSTIHFYFLLPAGMLRLETDPTDKIESVMVFNKNEAVNHLREVLTTAEDRGEVVYQELN